MRPYESKTLRNEILICIKQETFETKGLERYRLQPEGTINDINISPKNKRKTIRESLMRLVEIFNEGLKLSEDRTSFVFRELFRSSARVLINTIIPRC